MKLSVLFGVVGAVVVTGCSFSNGTAPGDAAVSLIEGPLSEQVGLNFVDVECNEPDSNETGETFACTATADGAAVSFLGVIEADERIFVAPSNVIDASEMSIVAAEAAQLLGEELGGVIDASAIVCPDETTVLDADDQLRCEITDENSGERFEMIVTATDFELRKGYGSRSYVIGEQLT